MKNNLLLLCLFMAMTVQSQTTTDFESFGLETGEFMNQALAENFIVDNLLLPNQYDENYDSYFGWAISATTDTTTPGFMNQYSAISGSGVNGSNTYGVAYVLTPSFTNEITLELTGQAAGAPVEGMYVNNGTYGYLSMLNGDGFAKKFGGETGDDPDFFLLTIKAELNGVLKTDSIDFYLADYRFADNTQDYIITEWTYLDLQSLGNVDKLVFTLSSSDGSSFGINTPSYFYVDDITTTDMPLSVRDQRLDWNVTLYPNPVQDQLQLDWPLARQGQASIFNAQGQLVRSFSLASGTNTLDVSALPTGHYYLRFTDGEQWNAQRFSKQ